jgi:hypothetical protein
MRRGCARVFPVDLRAWIMADHERAFSRFDQAITPYVPTERWKERPGRGGASIAWLLFHLSYHQDLAISAAVRGEPLVLDRHRAALGLDGAPRRDGLGESEFVEVTEVLDLDRLPAYASEVSAATAAFLATADLGRFDEVPPASERLEAAGATQADLPWLHQMWAGKPIAWLVQWEAIGHVHGHVGEMVSVRSRLGLSPF